MPTQSTHLSITEQSAVLAHQHSDLSFQIPGLYPDSSLTLIAFTTHVQKLLDESSAHQRGVDIQRQGIAQLHDAAADQDAALAEGLRAW